MKVIVAESLYSVEFNKNNVVTRQGDVGDVAYIVESGVYDVLINEGKLVATLKQGDSFGEVALMSSDSLRTATIRCAESGRLWALDRATYERCTK